MSNTAARSSHYRRRRTTSAPRKRTALILFSNYGSLRHPVAPGAGRNIDSLDGGSGGRGGAGGWGNGHGWNGGGDDGASGNGNGPRGRAAAALAAAVGVAAFAAAAQEGPARRSEVASSDFAGGPSMFGGLWALPMLAGQGLGGHLVVSPAEDDTLPGPSGLTRREVMLYDPPQYRVRDNIYIH